MTAGDRPSRAGPVAVMATGAAGIPMLVLVLATVGALPLAMVPVGIVLGLGWAAATLPALIRRLRG